MPYFAWQGIDINGRSCKGVACAHTAQDLSDRFLKKDVAVITSKEVKLSFWHRLHNADQTILLVKQLAFLLQAGVHLPKALQVIAYQAPLSLQEPLHKIMHEVEQGIPLYVSLEKHRVFNDIVATLAQVGMESGALAAALFAAVDYMQERLDVIKKLRTAALVPVMTLSVFCVVVVTIFTVMIPRFAALYQTAHQELPAITRVLIAMSDFLCSFSMFWFVGILFVCIISLIGYARTAAGAKKIDIFWAQFPCVGTVVKQQACAHFFASAALLSKSGMPLVKSLELACTMVSNKYLSLHFDALRAAVESGSSLSNAMVQRSDLFESDIIMLVQVGEETGQLPVMMSYIAVLYQTAIKAKITLLTTLFQPILIMILGIFIMVIIVAAYMPIFNLSNVF